MKILVTGCCGFAGSRLLQYFACAATQPCELYGIDNLSRPGSETNLRLLQDLGVSFRRGDLRCASDLAALPRMDWVVDASAIPSVLAGVADNCSSRQLVEHNLGSTINLLEYCRRHDSGFILLSSSRVYSVSALSQMPVMIDKDRFVLDTSIDDSLAVSNEGVREEFSTAAPVSMYGATKLASEILALEYHAAFKFPVWINRCGVLAGSGQFGRPDQGIVAYWVHSWRNSRALRYIGFDGLGHQVRDCLHPNDLAQLLLMQFATTQPLTRRTYHVSGGRQQSFSLKELSDRCTERYGTQPVQSDPQPRAYDVPWLILDSTAARKQWHWEPHITFDAIFAEVADHADCHPEWMSISQGH